MNPLFLRSTVLVVTTSLAFLCVACGKGGSGSDPIDAGSGGTPGDSGTGGSGGDAGVQIGWGEEQLIDTVGEPSSQGSPQIVVSPDGEALAIWIAAPGGTVPFETRAASYSSTGGWSDSVSLQADMLNDSSDTRIAVDLNGNGVALWAEKTPDETSAAIWASQYMSGQWSAAQSIDATLAGVSSFPAIAIGSDGEAVAVWQRDDTTVFSVWSNMFGPSPGWDDDAQLVETNDTDNASFPQVAVQAGVAPVAVWGQVDAGALSVWSSRLSATGWTPAVRVETAAGSSGSQQAVLTQDGEALAIWIQEISGTFRIWSNRTTGDIWGTPETIDLDGLNNGFGPKLAVTANGDVLATWQQNDGERISIYANRWVKSTGWQTAELLEQGDLGDAEAPAIAAGGDGSAIAVWSQDDGANFSAWANHYLPETGWGDAEIIESVDTGSSIRVQIAMDDTGRGYCIWQQLGPQTSEIMANTFVPSR